MTTPRFTSQEYIAALAERAVTDTETNQFEVEEVAHRLRIREAARVMVEAERRAADPAPPFDAGSLAQVLARPHGPPHRVEGLIPARASTLVVAQRKTGKTTFVLGLIRSLLRGDRFLGKFETVPIIGRAAILNYEVDGRQIARWAADMGIDGDRLYLVNLRGRRNPLDVEEDRAQLAAMLREQRVETLVVDPFGRAFSGASQNDSGEVGAWLTSLDRFARAEAGASDLILTAHAGWGGERSRGSSALEDWPDSIVTMFNGSEKNEGKRFLKAFGRDVDLPEDELAFEASTRLLYLAGTGSRKKASRERRENEDMWKVLPAVVEAVVASPGITSGELTRRVRETVTGFEDRAVSRAAQMAQNLDLIERQIAGPGKPIVHRPTGALSEGALERALSEHKPRPV